MSERCYSLPPSSSVEFSETDEFFTLNIRSDVILNEWTNAVSFGNELETGEPIDFYPDDLPEWVGLYQLVECETLSETRLRLLYRRERNKNKHDMEEVEFVGNFKPEPSTRDSRLSINLLESEFFEKVRDTPRVNLCRMFELLEYLTILHQHNPGSYFCDEKEDIMGYAAYKELG